MTAIGRTLKMNIRRHLATAAAALLMVPLVQGCAPEKPEVRPAGAEISAQTTTAAKVVLPVIVAATGSVEPEIRVNVSTRMMGWVRTLHAREGDKVVKGDPLLAIDDTDIIAKQAQVEAGISEAKAVMKNAEKTAARFQKLYDEKSVSRQQLDDVLTGHDRARAGYESALAARREIAVHLGYLDIKSPIDGVVGRLMLEEGDMATPGMPMLVLEQTERMKITASVGEKDVAGIAVGDEISVAVTSLPGAVYETEITRVTPAANPGSRTYEIEALVDNADGRLRSGMFARVLFSTGSREGIVVPATSIVERGQLRGVHIVDAEGRVGLRWIRLGRETAAGVEVLSGLAGGETIVLSSERPMVEGDRVVN